MASALLGWRSFDILKLFVATCVSIFAVSSAKAECSGEYCMSVKITSLYVDGDASNWVSTSGTETGLSCSPDSGKLLRLDQTKVKSDWLYSLFLSAYTTGQTLTIRVTASGQCVVRYAFIEPL